MDDYETGRFADITPADVDAVSSRTHTVQIVHRMLHDLRAHPDEWENHTLDRFLEALAACLADNERYNTAQPTWTLLTRALVTATGYE
ncbi:hypothetical protein AB4305_19230 [Nocardia sp. 2YAB30]|uniref:DUF7660 family protein n=1 Tax=unclassified Nocardia TaxID=2637762 RepID=UPI003F9A66EC